MRKLIFAAGCVALLAAAACNSPKSNTNAVNPDPAPTEQGGKQPPANVVTAKADDAKFGPSGGETDAKVTLSIAPGYHIHANPATLKYLIATTLTLSPPAGITADAPIYPKPQTKKFSFDPTPLSVFEGTAEIIVKLHAAGKPAEGNRPIAGKLRYQACDDNACYPPKTIDVAIPVVVN